MKRTRRRSKRDKQTPTAVCAVTVPARTRSSRPKPQTTKSMSLQKHGNDAASGGITALLPSFVGLAVLVCGVMAKMGFRGRATTAGVDLGTTNSAICVQAPSKTVGEIQCIPDPNTHSPIVPSVVSFLELSERTGAKKAQSNAAASAANALQPHPSHVVVGASAKRRIDTHPHHTLFNAKRVLARPFEHEAVAELKREVEFGVVKRNSSHDDTTTKANTEQSKLDGVLFSIPHQESQHSFTTLSISPTQVGSYVVNYLMDMTRAHLRHDTVQSAVICVPAKFDARQRQATVAAFRNAGIAVTRILEEPTAAALAYGLHKKEGVEYILVYDFGGGTLDVSLLHVTDGFCDVMGSDGDDQLGGADFDAAVAHVLLEHRGGQEIVDRVSTVLKQLENQMPTDSGTDLEEILSASCPVLQEKPLCTMSSFHTIGEQLKIELSEYPNGGGTVGAECLGLRYETLVVQNVQSFCNSLTAFPLSLTSSEYKTAVDPLYERGMTPVYRLLEDLNLDQTEIDEVVMVGGTTRIPEIRRRVQEALGDEATLNTSIDPDITVAYGAASVID